MDDKIRIELAYAGSGKVYLRELVLPRGATVAGALAASDLAEACTGIDPDVLPVGIHGRKVARDQILRDGDRVEVYRALRIDPMQARRARARRGQD